MSGSGEICAPQFIGNPSWESETRVRMKSGGSDVPSSIDIRPMGKKRTNAYAQMGSSHEAHRAQSSTPEKAASSS